MSAPDGGTSTKAVVVERGHAPLSPRAIARGWSRAALPTDPLLRISWGRYISAFRHYRWLSLLLVTLGAAVGIVFARRVMPEYEVSATLWVRPDASGSGSATPVRVAPRMRHDSWPELVTSFAILDKVVRRLRLQVVPAKASDSVLFAGLQTDEGLRAGRYELKVDASGWQYRLLRADGSQVQAGILGDSVGRAIGLRWKPPATALGPGRTVAFTLLGAREAALSLRGNLTVDFPGESELLRLTLRGDDPQRITTALAAILDAVVATASDLKKRNMSEMVKALKEQVNYAEREQRGAGAAFESYRVQTAALPSDAPSPDDADATRSAVVDGYLSRQVEYETLRRDRHALERTLEAMEQGGVDGGALSAALATVGGVPASLGDALAELAERERALRAARLTFTDDHTTVRDLEAQAMELRRRTIPRLVQASLAEVRRRESDQAATLQGAAQQLRALPARTTEENRLRRSAEARGAMLASLKSRYDVATQAERNTVPDLGILDEPVAPQYPSPTRTTYLILVATIGALALALALVALLDRRDPRFRHVEQATDEMGLEVVGAIPLLSGGRPGRSATGDAVQLLESFRAMRLSLTHAFDTTECVALTVSSPSPGDGKSLVSTQLARSFAEAGFGTLLVDGDLRRGELHSRFGLPCQPGLLDHLTGDAALDDVLQDSRQGGLTLLSRGASPDPGAQLLMSPRLPRLMAELRRRYEVIIVDSAPLGAGIEPLVLGSATASLLLVLRAGASDRRMAESKLELLDRLPIRLLGVVLNGIRVDGTELYRAYADSAASARADGGMYELGR
jgi:capsular exopolysaccharide synthesis family protein